VRPSEETIRPSAPMSWIAVAAQSSGQDENAILNLRAICWQNGFRTRNE
jgi:hypothetical protein